MQGLCLKQGVAAAVALAAVACTAPAAMAGGLDRYAAPDGSGIDCTSGNRCSIETAVESNTTPGAVVHLQPGTYTLTDNLQITDGVDVDGEGLPSDTVIGSTADIAVTTVFSSPGSILSDVTIDHDTSTVNQSFGLELISGLAERVVVESTGGNYACFVSGTLRDSICENSSASGGVGAGLFGPTDATGTLRNVTAIANAPNGNALFAAATVAGADLVLDGRNIIAQGATDQGAIAPAGATADVDLHHSNFDTLGISGSATGTLNTENNNQGELPLLDADFRQLPDSPTIDAGDPATPGLGSLDIDLGPRVEGDGVDIGADEFVPAVVPPDTEAPGTEITKQPKKKTTKRKAKIKFESSEAGSTFECKLDKKPFKACESPFKKKVKAGKKHKFLVRAIDAAGNPDPTPAKIKWKVLEKD